jgi:hypothetical protein
LQVFFSDFRIKVLYVDRPTLMLGSKSVQGPGVKWHLSTDSAPVTMEGQYLRRLYCLGEQSQLVELEWPKFLQGFFDSVALYEDLQRHQSPRIRSEKPCKEVVSDEVGIAQVELDLATEEVEELALIIRRFGALKVAGNKWVWRGV